MSTVAAFNTLMAQRPDLVKRLFEPFRLDSREGKVNKTTPYSLIAPCCFDGERLSTFYHSDYFRSVERHEGISLQEDEKCILDFYDALGEDPSCYFDMQLTAGDIQFVSNHVIAHARTAYEDYPEPERRRHLLRLWLSAS